MKLTQVSPSKLIEAKYNPPIRTSKKEIFKLMASIKSHGILIPILADKNLNVIDGHRRLKCAKSLGLTTVPIIISTNHMSADETYEIVNSTQRKMYAREMIYVYLKGGKVPTRIKSQIVQLEAIVGVDELKKLGNKYVAPNIIHSARRIGMYVSNMSDDFLKSSILWLAKHRQVYQIRRAIEDSISTAALKKAISQDRPLNRKWK